MEPLAVLAAVLAHCAAVLAMEDPDLATAASEGRTQHRTGMVFPLLLAISRRLAALIPTALMSLVAIAAMLVFAKKAFLMSAAALAVAMYDSYRSRKKQQKTPYHTEIIEPLEFTEVHFKPAPYSYSKPSYSKSSYSKSPYSKASSSSYYKRPSSYDVPLHAGASSYYRQPVAGYSKPFDAYPSPSQSLDTGGSGGSGGNGDTGSSYEVVDDYRPLGGGPAFVADASEQQESFSPFYPNHLQQDGGSPQAPASPSPTGEQTLTPEASGHSPVSVATAYNHRPAALAPLAPLALVQGPQYYRGPPAAPGFQAALNHRTGNRAGRARTEAKPEAADGGSGVL